MSAPLDIYVRYSSLGDREVDALQTLDDQERSARNLADARGLEVHAERIEDHGVSGGTTDRAGLQRVLARIASGESSGVVVAYLDRLTRGGTREGRELLERIVELGGKVYAPDLPQDVTTPEGDLQVDLFLSIGSYYRRRAAVYLRSAKARAIAAGVPVQSVVPLGYRRAGVGTSDEERRLEPDPDTSAVIHEMFERRARGVGLTPLAEYVEAETGRHVTKQGVSAMVHSRTYLGELRSGEFVNTAAHEPIVDLALWEAAQRPYLIPQRARGEGWLLSGIARCESCGYALSPWTASLRDHKARRYKCTQRKCTARASIKADVLEALVSTQFLGFWRKSRYARTTPGLEGLNQTLTDAERRLAHVLGTGMQDALGEAWAETVRSRRQERDLAAEALGRARAETPPAVTTRGLWDGADTAERKELLARSIGVVLLSREKGVTILPREARAGYSKRQKRASGVRSS